MYPSSSSKVVQEVEEANTKPEWLEPFLQETFFDSCHYHLNLRGNERNRYCITCKFSACQHCISSCVRSQHKLLKIYRHVYKDVVSLTAMQKYMDCSRIQPYKSNKRLVISLSPLPHCGTTSSNNGSTCKTCDRRLAEPDQFNYCSISCKVTAFERKECNSSSPFLSLQSTSTKEVPQKKVSKPEDSKRKRKGTPRRAPFF